MDQPQNQSLNLRIAALRRARKPLTVEERAAALSARKRYHASKDLVGILESLVTRAGDARERLYRVSPGVMLLQRDDFPANLWDVFDEVRKTVERFEPYLESPVSGRKFLNSVKRAVWGMRQSTAQRAAQGLWDLYWSVSKNTEYEGFEVFLDPEPKRHRQASVR